NFSVLATPTRSTGTLTAYDGTGDTFVTSSLEGNKIQPDRGFKTDQNTFSGDLDVWLGTTNYVTFRGGYFHDNYADTGIPSTTSVLWNTPSIGVAGVPPILQQPKGFQNTPPAQITDFDTTNTGFFQIDYNHEFTGAGTHLIKGGFGVRHTVNDVNLYYPGGYVLLNWDRSFTSNVTGLTGRGTYGNYEVDNRGTTGAVNANMPSLYVQDTWTIANRLALNLGIRTEKETIPSFREDIKKNAFDFNFGDKIAPRLGASYDVLGNGRLKAFGSWGRYYDWVKYELARGSYGGDFWHIYYRGLDTLNVFSLNLDNKPGADLWGSASGFRDRRVPNFDSTDPNIKPMYQDATNAGIEYQINPTTVFGATYVHNKLTRTIEDLGGVVNGDEVYVIGNPGEG